ncbi:hypothetical protein Q73_16475, partial [Bacillus coahuilensis m2-6]|uniref:HlyD family efflux transporter periplasmic adaptor subunit n=1 Tax=Bacillus coahuilensis TaxID=408580 RepID=UPI00079A4E8C
ILIFINNDDIRKIQYNQNVKIQLPSNKTNGHETLKGKVIFISKEPIVDNERKVFTYYARAEIEDSITLPNGIQGKAIIVTNKISSLQYVLSKLNLRDT